MSRPTRQKPCKDSQRSKTVMQRTQETISSPNSALAYEHSFEDVSSLDHLESIKTQTKDMKKLIKERLAELREETSQLMNNYKCSIVSSDFTTPRLEEPDLNYNDQILSLQKSVQSMKYRLDTSSEILKRRSQENEELKKSIQQLEEILETRNRQETITSESSKTCSCSGSCVLI
mmetsp:Transcript_9768/g.14569  ORF Transcript_9768/g.14569 Transcript_9768/m.14569 type:complete len:175 (+) Transcript_9768:2-526(+)